MEVACPGAQDRDNDPRTWKLPPVVPINLLARRLEVWLQKLLGNGASADLHQASVLG